MLLTIHSNLSLLLPLILTTWAIDLSYAFKFVLFSARHSTTQTFVSPKSSPQSTRALGINDLFEDSFDEVENVPITLNTSLIPTWLRGGVLIRNGPSIFGTVPGCSGPTRRYTHIFDGLARLTRYEFSKDGAILFSAKFLRSHVYDQLVTKKGDIPPSVTTGAVEPDFNYFQKLYSVYYSIFKFDNVPVNVHQIGSNQGPWVATTDAPVMLEFDPHTLETKQRIFFRNQPLFPMTSVELFTCAHPHRSKLFTYNYVLELKATFPPTTVAHIVRIDDNLQRMVVGSIELENGMVPYVHDFTITENYAVLCVWPVSIDLSTNINGKGFLSQLQWLENKGTPTKIYVFNISAFESLNTQSGSLPSRNPIASFEAPPMFAYHHVNAYEEATVSSGNDSNTNVHIVLDVTGYDTPAIANGKHGFAYISNVKDPKKRLKQECDGTCYRFRLSFDRPTGGDQNDKTTAGANNVATNASSKWVSPIKLHAFAKGRFYTSKLVRINPLYQGRPYRFSYGFTGFAGDEAFEDWAIVKQDHTASEKGTQTLVNDEATYESSSAFIWKDQNCYPSEPIFVPNPQGLQEDDGVLLSQVYDGARRETFLLILDAKSMVELERCYTGVRCPISFHGDYIAP